MNIDTDNEQFKYFPDVEEYFYYMNSAHIKKDIQYVIDNNIKNVALNKYHGYTMNNISEFEKLIHIKKLSIEPSNVLSIKEPLSKLVNLEYLHIGVDKMEVDFSNLKKLKWLYFDYHKKVKGFDSLKKLEVLHIYRANKNFFTEAYLKHLTKLRRLEIVQSKDLQNLACLVKLTSLKELEFHYCRSAINLSFLEKFKEQLKVLKIGNCKNVLDIDKIKQLKKLEWLAVVDSVPLESADIVNYLPNLEVLIVLGKSHFMNGDLSILKDMKLRHVGIDNKRHYNMKYEDFKK